MAKIAELFVQLGVKGADKSTQALTSVSAGFADIKKMSFEAKAAIAGVLYGLEEFARHAVAQGTALGQFQDYTGQSTDMLQRWQYLAIQAGTSTQQMTSDIVGLQEAMAKLFTTGKGPETMTAMANILGPGNFQADPGHLRNPGYMMEKLREVARRTQGNPDIGNAVLRGFLSPQTITALRSEFAAKPPSVPTNQSYGAYDINQLREIGRVLRNIGDEFTHTFGKIVVDNGPTIVKGFKDISEGLLDLIRALARLNEALPILKVLGETFRFIANGLKGDALVIDDIKNPDHPMLRGMLNSVFGTPPLPALVSTPAGTAGNQTQTNNYNVNIPVSGAQAPQATAQEIARKFDREMNNAFRQGQQGGNAGALPATGRRQ